MKKIYLLFSSILIINIAFSQLDNDLLLVKPLVNFNYPDGGFYSDFYETNLNCIYNDVIVQNVGNYSATNVYVEINYLDWSNNVMSTHYSDTITFLDTNQVDTLSSQQVLPFSTYWIFSISYKIICDSIDDNVYNNIDTIPPTEFEQSMWSRVSRANIPTDTFNINKVPGFNSGDFIGVTLKYPIGMFWYHQLASLGVYLYEEIPDSLTIIGKVFENGVLIASTIIDNGGYSTPGWIGSYWLGFDLLNYDSTYYFGVELYYPPGTNIPIGIDTSYHHNFKSETVARINGVWTALDFVPLIRLVCDPEDISEIYNEKSISIFPNPTTGKITLQAEELESVEVYNLQGQIISKKSEVGRMKCELDLSKEPKGIYIIKVTTSKGVTVEKVVLE